MNVLVLIVAMSITTQDHTVNEHCANEAYATPEDAFFLSTDPWVRTDAALTIMEFVSRDCWYKLQADNEYCREDVNECINVWNDWTYSQCIENGEQCYWSAREIFWNCED